MKPILSRHIGMRVFTMVLLSFFTLISVLINIPVVKAGTKAATTPYYLETYTVKQGKDTYQYKVHEYPTLTETDNTSQGYNYPSQSVNMGWVDVDVNGVYKTNLAGTVDHWDKDQGSTLLTRNSDANLTDTGNFFQPNSISASDDGWWPNDGGAWNYVANPDPNCTLAAGPIEAPWGDLQATLNCLNFAAPGTTSFLSGYDRHLNKFIKVPWSSPAAQAFGHGFWQETTGVTSMYQNLHTSDQASVAAIPLMPSHFGPSTFSSPAFLASYNAMRKGITSTLQAVSRSSARPAIVVSLAIAVGLIAIGFVMTAIGGYLAAACLGQTDVGCLGKHTAVWNRVGAVMVVVGGGMLFLGSLHPGLGPAIWGARAALAGGAAAAEGVELTAAAVAGGAAVATTASVAAEEALIESTFLASLV